MARYTIGRILPIFQGSWDSTQSYDKLDIVLKDTISYVSLIDDNNTTPSENNANWQVVCRGATAEEVVEVIEGGQLQLGRLDVDDDIQAGAVYVNGVPVATTNDIRYGIDEISIDQTGTDRVNIETTMIGGGGSSQSILAATSSRAGVMSAADKANLDSLVGGGNLSDLEQRVADIESILDIQGGSSVTSYTVTLGYYSSSSSSMGSVSGGGTYREGTTITVTATANSGYVFDGWFSSNSNISSLITINSSYTFTVSANRTIYAKFSVEQVIPDPDDPTPIEPEIDVEYEAELTSINEAKNDGSNYGIISSTSVIKATTNPNWDTWVCELPSGYGAHIFAQSADAIGDHTGSSYYELRYGTTDTNPLTTLATASEAALTIEYADYGMLKHSHWVSAANSDRFLCVSGNANTYGSSLVVTLFKVDSEDSAVAFSGIINDTAIWFTASRPYIYKSSSSSTYQIKYHLLEAGKIGFLTADFTVKSKNANKQFGVGYSNDDTIPYLDTNNPYQVNIAATGNLFNVTSSVKSGKYHFVFEPVNFDRYILVNCDYNTSGTVGWMSNVRLTKITPYTAPTPVLLSKSFATKLMLSSSNNKHSERLDEIEARLDAIDTSGSSSEVNTRISALETSVANNTRNIATNASNIAANAQAIEDLGGSSTATIDDEGLHLHCQATSKGQVNFIKRARQMTDIKWKPAYQLIRMQSSWRGEKQTDYFTANKEYKGIPYSQNYNHYNHSALAVGNIVSLDAFMTTTRTSGTIQEQNQPSSITGTLAAYYGIYCSGLWAYAYDVQYCYLTSIPDTQGFTAEANAVGALTAANIHNYIRLGDTMINCPNTSIGRTATASHVVLITDIIYNENGTINAIEVSEATTSGRYNVNIIGGDYGGVCRREFWLIDEFLVNWATYTILHYNNFEHITYTPSPYVQVGNESIIHTNLEIPLLPYLGNYINLKYTYFTNNSYTKIVMVPKYTGTIEVENMTTGSSSSVECTANTTASVTSNEAGTYRARINCPKNGTDYYSRYCYWHVGRADITATKATASGTKITFTVTTYDQLDIPFSVSFASSSTATAAPFYQGYIKDTTSNKILSDLTPTVNGNGTYTYTFSITRPSTSMAYAYVTFHCGRYGGWQSDAITITTA